MIERVIKGRILYVSDRVGQIGRLLNGKLPKQLEQEWKHKLPQIKLHLDFLTSLLPPDPDVEIVRRIVSAKCKELELQIKAHQAMIQQVTPNSAEQIQYSALLEEYQDQKLFLEELLEDLIPAKV